MDRYTGSACVLVVVAMITGLVIACSHITAMYVEKNGLYYSCPPQAGLDNYFFNSEDCKPYLGDGESVWHAKVEKVNAYNQNLFIYANVTEKDLAATEVEVNYQLNLQGRKRHSDEWEIISLEELTVNVACTLNLCSEFKIAYLPTIEYESYEVTIKAVTPGDSTISFQLFYTSFAYTQVQSWTRALFFFASSVIAFTYTTRVMCRIKKQ